MTRSYQYYVTQKMMDGYIARFEYSDVETRYMYYRGDRCWLLAVRDGKKRFERPVGGYRMNCIFDEYYVEVVSTDEVPGPVAALSRTPPVE